MKAFHAINRILHGGVCYRNNYARRKIERFIKEKGIDLIHFHNIANNYFGIQDMAYFAKRYKVVWTLHDMWSFTGHCAAAFDCLNWKTGCKTCPNKDNPPGISKDISNQVWKEKKACFTGRDIVFVTPSKWLEKLAKQTFLKNEQIITINNGVDFGNQIQCKIKPKSDKITLLFAAANINSPCKGLDVLEGALRVIDFSGKIQLAIMGTGTVSKEIQEKYKVVHYGFVNDRKQKEKIYSLADVLVVTSHSDNYPTVIIEAMACGVPAIGSRVGGIPELIPNECGWILPTNTVEELCGVLKLIVNNKDLLIQKGTCCKKIYEENLSLDRMTKQYIDLYRKMISDE